MGVIECFILHKFCKINKVIIGKVVLQTNINKHKGDNGMSRNLPD